jgi:DNA-binding GntR family transcriptional regulator
MSWSDFFHGSLHDEIVALAEALESGDAEAARRSIARICA